MDRAPTSDRWHSAAIPTVGGVAIFFGAALVVGTASEFDSASTRLALAAGIAFVTGLVDDIKAVRPWVKILALLVAGAVIGGGPVLPLVSASGWLRLALAVLLVLLLANAFNIIDNMDGVCAGVAVVAAICLLVWNLSAESSRLEISLVALIGAVLGFLVFNIHPARIFMGDAGSLFIGTCLAGLSLYTGAPGWVETPSTAWFVSLMVPGLLFIVPLADVVLVFVDRVRHGRPVMTGGKDHSSHRLVASGLGDRTAAALLWATGVIGAGAASVLWVSGTLIGAGIVTVLLLGLLGVLLWLWRIPVYS